MSAYRFDEIDPTTIHLNVDVPFVEHLASLVYQAKLKARMHGKIVLVHHVEEVTPSDIEGGSPTVTDLIRFRDYEKDFFDSGYHQCPRNADATWEELNKRPRPFPSILVDETGQVVVSKPSLCDSCVFGLQRKVQGHCDGRKFKALPEVLV